MRELSYLLDLDWELLQAQKDFLIRLPRNETSEDAVIDGLLNLIDEIQDQAVDCRGLSEEVVFGEMLVKEVDPPESKPVRRIRLDLNREPT